MGAGRVTVEGLFLGGEIDPSSGERTDALVDYDPADLTTHGVIVGMTGSGKTGLGMIFLEEALLKGIPALIIDPKGDMTNLLLTFPELAPADFEPWIDPAEAKREGVSVTELAAAKAELWSNGLGSWGLDGARIAQLRDTVGLAVYTPGSRAGIPVNIVGSLANPGLDWDTEAESLRDQIQGFASGLLGLLGIDADPISSKEHILISNLVEHAWRAGQDLDLARLVGQIQDPPLRKLGVFEIDSFVSPEERRDLAVGLNGLLASPAFSEWTAGAPLDIASLLWDSTGKPQGAVVHLAHLSDQERQFVVTLLLSQMVTWMRAQQGTGDLRALVYMDEVFGFVPPVAEPPAKRPILTLFKQARAFGVGMLLSTQNPVDLDYKAISNAGTWCIGRLQTERDKARMLEGLRSAAGDVDVAALDRAISGLDNRQFILHRTGGEAPTRFTTRWALSYLAGPLTRQQVSTLMADRKGSAASTGAAGGTTEGKLDPAAAASGTATPEDAASQPAAPAPVPEGSAADDTTPVMPAVVEGTTVRYLHPSAPWAAEAGADVTSTTLHAVLAVRVQLTYDETKGDILHHQEWEAIVPIGETADVAVAIHVDYDDRDLIDTAPPDSTYRIPAARLDTKALFARAATDLTEHLYRIRSLQVPANPELGIYGRPGETAEAFAARCDAAARERADEETAKLRDKYTTKIDAARKRFEKADRRVNELQADVSGSRQEEVMSGAETLINILTGRGTSRAAGKAARNRSSTRQREARLDSAKETALSEWDAMAELDAELAAEVEDIDRRWSEAADHVEHLEVRLEKSDIHLDELVLLWLPGPG
ncbi:MAG: ATP-binding protein [Acidimicrobiia bacterium]|nr:ATP-binding protein [Acidimicrobiia bacterium]